MPIDEAREDYAPVGHDGKDPFGKSRRSGEVLPAGVALNLHKVYAHQNFALLEGNDRHGA